MNKRIIEVINNLNWTSYSNNKNFVIVLLGLIFLAIIRLLFLLLYMLYLSFKSKPNLVKEEINKNNHLNLDRRNLKDAKSYSFRISKKIADKFKLECAKNRVTMASNVENFMLDYLSKKGGKSNA